MYWWPSARFLDNHVSIAQKIIWFPNRQLRYEPHQYQSTLLNNLFSYLTDSEVAELDIPSDSTSSKHHTRMLKTGEMLFVPYNILQNDAVTSVGIRNNISPAVMSAVLSTLIVACNGDPAKFTLSYAQSFR